MPTFVWKGRTATGASASGELAAGSQADVVAALRQKKIIPTSIKIKEEKKGLTLFGGRVSTRALGVFTRQFSTMLNAGLPLLSCLEILGKQTESPALRRVLGEVRGDVEGGYHSPMPFGGNHEYSTICTSTWLNPGKPVVRWMLFFRVLPPTSRNLPRSCVRYGVQ
jgi:type II secretory pathway component PulF